MGRQLAFISVDVGGKLTSRPAATICSWPSRLYNSRARMYSKAVRFIRSSVRRLAVGAGVVRGTILPATMWRALEMSFNENVSKRVCVAGVVDGPRTVTHG